ncbi:MAG: hypothetical protein CMO66_02645 [Verrucomicrobiales bacterium]|nr:hypothetical protein [Verrucomicrobiales bacterium]
MSSLAESPRNIILGSLLASAGLIILSLFLPRVTGLHAKLPDPLKPLTQEISYKLAVENSLAGTGVILDLRSPDKRAQNPVPGGAIVVPEESGDPKWDKLAPLLESLVDTPVYVIFPAQGEHPGFFKIRSRPLDLWSVNMSH